MQYERFVLQNLYPPFRGDGISSFDRSGFPEGMTFKKKSPTDNKDFVEDAGKCDHIPIESQKRKKEHWEKAKTKAALGIDS